MNTSISSQHRLNQKEPHILILIIMSSFASMGAIIFAPALPEIAAYFHISGGHSQLTITLFLLGYAIGQLIYGPLANRFGRKPAFFIGIVIATIGSLISIASEPLHSFGALILGRLLEALGSSAGLIVSFTIISDHYYPEQARRIVAYLMLAFAIVPGIATFIGGFLTSYFHWISCFYFLLIYGLALILPAAWLKETAQELKKDATHAKQILKNYGIALKNKLLISTTLFFALSGMCVYLYVASSPFIAINDLHLTPQFYGLIGLIPFVGTALGSIVSAQLASRFSVRILMLAGFMIDISAAVLFCVLFYLGLVNIPVLIGCGFILMFGNCLIVGNGASIATSTSEDKANASAMMNFINVGMVMVGTFLLAVTPGVPTVKLPVGLVLAMLVMGVVWFSLIQSRK
ncbi:MAG TPA: multidrug effflux MFS transporter [Gammaproteobacteria bacterium]|nr:multidrug effflux MFS transporter [Gammaproteobacteria bacterium]